MHLSNIALWSTTILMKNTKQVEVKLAEKGLQQ